MLELSLGELNQIHDVGCSLRYVTISLAGNASLPEYEVR
jgi:hypothetical protein